MLLLSLEASNFGNKISASADIEKSLNEKSEKINKTIVDVIVISAYSLLLKDKTIFYLQKEKELISLMED